MPEDTAEILKRNKFQWETRGTIKVKGKQPMMTYFIVGSGNTRLPSKTIALDQVKLINEEMSESKSTSCNGREISNPKNMRPTNSKKFCNGNVVRFSDVREEDSDLESSFSKSVKNGNVMTGKQANNEQNVAESPKSEHVTETEQVNQLIVTESHGGERNLTELKEKNQNVIESQKCVENVTEPVDKGNQSHKSEGRVLKRQQEVSGLSESQENVDKASAKDKTNVIDEQRGDIIVTGKNNSEVLIRCEPRKLVASKSEECLANRRNSEPNVSHRKSETNLTERRNSEQNVTSRKSDGRCDKNGIVAPSADAKKLNCYRTKICVNGMEKSKYDEFCEKSDEHEHVVVDNCDVIMRRSLKLKKNVIK